MVASPPTAIPLRRAGLSLIHKSYDGTPLPSFRILPVWHDGFGESSYRHFGKLVYQRRATHLDWAAIIESRSSA